MQNKRIVVVGALLCAALATAGIALAKVKSGGVAGVSATFNATSVVKDVQKTCTVNGGDTYTYTRAVYSGTSTSADSRLNGNVKMHVQSMIDDTTGTGALIGDYNLGTGKLGSYGRIEASLSGGQANGALRGHVRLPWGELFAGLNGSFTPLGGFSNVSVGTGVGVATGVVLSKGACVHVIYLH